jgi:hypothetical protein
VSFGKLYGVLIKCFLFHQIKFSLFVTKLQVILANCASPHYLTHRCTSCVREENFPRPRSAASSSVDCINVVNARAESKKREGNTNSIRVALYLALLLCVDSWILSLWVLSRMLQRKLPFLSVCAFSLSQQKVAWNLRDARALAHSRSVCLKLK